MMKKGKVVQFSLREEKLITPSILKDINIMFPLVNEKCTLLPMLCEYLCMNKCKCWNTGCYKP